MAPPPMALQDLGGGVHLIDTGFQRPGFDAAYLVVDDGEAAFIDTGTGLALPRLLQALNALGLTPAQVRWVIPTHVHLDHAGGVGPLMRHLPAARVLVHPRGARHLIDPTALFQGALAVYGPEEMARSYGPPVAVAADRVDTSHDGQAVPLGRRELTLIDTPGHARHHHAVWDPVTRGWFTGDTAGLSYRELDIDGRPWQLPTTTPVQFEPQALRQTLARLEAQAPDCLYLTHFGRIRPVPRLSEGLGPLLDAVEALGLALRDAPQRHEALKAGLARLYLADLARAGSRLPADAALQCLAMDIELNAQGMGLWLDRLPAP